MRKARNGFAKNLNYLCLAGVVALGLITIVASGGGGGDGAAPSSPGTPPTISDVKFYDSPEGSETYLFTIDEDAYIELTATDPDSDMTALLITQYHPADADTPYYGPDSIALPAQSDTTMTYSNIAPIDVTGPAGTWRIEFQIVDSKGNESNVLAIVVSVDEGSPGTAPTINNVAFYDVNWTISSSFNIGDYAHFRVIASDADKDMEYLFITQYHPADADTPYYDPPDRIYLNPLQSETYGYFSTVDPIEITGPAGTWRFEFQIEDSNSNTSNVFPFFLTID
jgi:hypothetical protein